MLRSSRKLQVICAIVIFIFIGASQALIPGCVDSLTNWMLESVKSLDVNVPQYLFVRGISYILCVSAAIFLYCVPLLLGMLYKNIFSIPSWPRQFLFGSAILACLFCLPLGIEVASQSADVGLLAVCLEMHLQLVKVGGLLYIYVALWALCEEIVFRYLALHLLCEVMHPTVAAILCSVAFGIVHYINIVDAAVFGIFTNSLFFSLAFITCSDFAKRRGWVVHRAFGLLAATAIHCGSNIQKMLIDGFVDPPILRPSKLSVIYDLAGNRVLDAHIHLNHNIAIRLVVCFFLYGYYYLVVGRRQKAAR